MTVDFSAQKMWTEADILAAQLAGNGGRAWGSPVELETRRRITLCVATFAYEVADAPFMDDHTWDRLAQSIRPRMGTCHPLLDEFFVGHFSPMTGMWIHDHPELDKVRETYERYYRTVLAA